jgi:hypothetical protein
VNNKKRFSRGRRPGVKPSGQKKVNSNERPNLRRFSLSMPRELARTVAKLKPMLDQEYSKLFRHGFDLVVNEGFKNGKIDKKTYDEYWTVRRLFKDEDFGTCSTNVEEVIDLDREPTEEEIRSMWGAPKNVLTKIIESKPRLSHA